MKAYTMTASRLTEHSNQAKEIFLKKMLKEEIITLEQCETLNKYCVVVNEKHFFGSFWNKMFKKDDEMIINIVKIIE